MFTNPKENLKALKLSEGMRVADFGAGSGGYTIPVAKEVGEGKVYALDIQNSLLDRIQREADEKGLSNVEIIWTDLEKEEGSGLKENSVDAVIMSNTLFQVERKEVFIQEAKRVLRPGGKVLVVDWSDSYQGLGPQADKIFSEERAKKLFKDNGFNIEGTLRNPGAHHYAFVARLMKDQ